MWKKETLVSVLLGDPTEASRAVADAAAEPSARRLRVLHAIPGDGLAGTEIATRRIADAVRPLGVDSAALLLRPCAELRTYFEQAGIPCITEFTRPEPSVLRTAGSFLRDSRRLAPVLADFDVVHCADIWAAYYIGFAGRLARRPTICHVRNRALRLAHRSRLFIGAASHFVFVSDATRRGFPIQPPERRTSILYDGVDIPAPASADQRLAAARAVRSEFQLPDDAVIAAMFARVDPQKDYATLIRAAALLRDAHPRLRFLIVGDNANLELHRTHFQEMRELARANRVLDRFIFTGFRPDARRLMVAADICVLCTHFEGLPLVLIEAMAAGRPCVATAVDGIPETLTEGVTGLLHAHQDAESLATALARLAGDAALAERMGENARAEAERRFSHTRFARDVRALYEKLARPKSAASPTGQSG